MSDMPKELKTLLDYALKYFELGFSVAPLKYQDKTPEGKYSLKWHFTNKLRHDALIQIFNTNEKNIALIMGNISGFAALDLDGGRAIVHFAEAIQRIENPLPQELKDKILSSILAETGSGGRHIIFRFNPTEWPAGIPPKTLWTARPTKEESIEAEKTGKKTTIEIRLKSDQGYIVAAPSIHPDTKRSYRIVKPVNFASITLDQLPVLSRLEIEEWFKAIDLRGYERFMDTVNGKTEISGSGNEESSLVSERSSIMPTTDIELKALGSTILTKEEMSMIITILKPAYVEGSRNDIIFHLSGFLRKRGVSLEQSKLIVRTLAHMTQDDSKGARIKVLEDTFGKRTDPKKLSGSNGLLELFRNSFDDNTALTMQAELEQVVQKMWVRTDAQRKDDEKKLTPVMEQVKETEKRKEKDDKDYVKTISELLLTDHYFFTVAEDEEIYLYENGVYIRNAATEVIKSRCAKEAGFDLSPSDVSTIENNIILHTIGRLHSLDGKLNILNVKNGLIDITTGTFQNHDPNYLSVTQIPVEYRPKKVCTPDDYNCPQIMRYLVYVLEPADIKVCLQYMAYCLYRSMPEALALMLQGGGNNGKSVFIGVLKAFLGKQNISSVSLQSLEDNRFAASELFGKLANLYADISSQALQNTGKFKMLSSGDVLTAERKFGHPYSFENYAKLVFSANQVPKSEDDTNAFYRRWNVVNFAKYIDNPDVNLLEKLTTPEELSGLLNLLIPLLRYILRNGLFRKSSTSEQAKKTWLKNANPIRAFIEVCVRPATERDDTLYSTKTAVYDAWLKFKKHENLGYISAYDFAEELKNKFGWREFRPRTNDGKRIWAWENQIIRDFLAKPEEQEGQKSLF